MRGFTTQVMDRSLGGGTNGVPRRGLSGRGVWQQPRPDSPIDEGLCRCIDTPTVARCSLELYVDYAGLDYLQMIFTLRKETESVASPTTSRHRHSSITVVFDKLSCAHCGSLQRYAADRPQVPRDPSLTSPISTSALPVRKTVLIPLRCPPSLILPQL